MSSHSSADRKQAVKAEWGPASRLTDSDHADVMALALRFLEPTGPVDAKSMLGKGQVCTLRCRESGALRGVVAVQRVTVRTGRRRRSVLLTTFACLDPGLRGNNVIQKAGMRSYLRSRLRHPFRPVLWVYTTRSWRSYALATRNFEEYYPNGNLAPQWVEQTWVEAMTTAGRGETFPELHSVQRADGLIDPEQTHHDGVAVTPEAKEFSRLVPADPSLHLCVVVPLHARNLRAMISRALSKGRGRAQLETVPAQGASSFGAGTGRIALD